MTERLRLCLNVDHVATVRNARGGRHPDPVRAAQLAAAAGADGIVAHLREDRRHIRDDDIERLLAEVDLPLNLEMAATEEMLEIALASRPFAVCIVPEKREELTTEGGLDAAGGREHLAPFVAKLLDAGCRVSLFVGPDLTQVRAAKEIGAPAVELHTGAYCDSRPGTARDSELSRLIEAAADGHELGLECHAGHGLNFDTVGPIAAIAGVVELNIGHFLIGESIFGGLDSSIRRMRALMDKARSETLGLLSA